MRLLLCATCRALVDPSDFPGFERLGTHADPIPGGCGGRLIPAPIYAAGPVGG